MLLEESGLSLGPALKLAADETGHHLEHDAEMIFRFEQSFRALDAELAHVLPHASQRPLMQEAGEIVGCA